MHARNFLAVVSVCCFTAFANAAYADEASHDVLAHWVGDWTTADTGADGKSDSPLGRPTLAKAEWTLDNKFVQGANSDASAKLLGIWMLHFDDKSGEYKVWYFTADNKAFQWNGTWSESDSTMHWKGNEVGNSLTGYTKFAGDIQSWELKFEQVGKTTTDTGSLQKK